MKAIKKIIGLSLVMIFTVSSIIAQKSEKRKNLDPTAHAKKKTERLTKALSLTPEQTAKVAEINLAYAEKMTAIKSNSTDKEAKRTAVESMRTDQKAAIKAVLTAEQATKFETMKGRRGGKKGKGRKGADKTPQERAQHQTARLTEALGLSKTQAAQVTEINLAFGEKKATIKENTKDRATAKPALEALKAEHKTAIKAVLTPEQITKFDAMKKRRGGKRGKGKGEGSKQL